MSEIEGGGGGEVSSSSEVSETSVAETGGESSEATQEATTEEAGESGGFDEDTDTTESPEDSAEDYEESDSDEEPDDSQEVGFSEGDDVENADSQYDGSDYENDDTSSGDEDGVGFDDSDDDINDGIDEDTDSDTDSSDSPMDEDNDESFDEPNDYEDETSESDWDDQEDEDIGENEDYSDEEPFDDSTEDGDDIDDAQDDGEAQTEDTDSDADGDEADGDMDNDGEPDDAEADTEDGDNLDDNWDDQEYEDLGEPEDYSDEESLDDSTEDGDDINDAQDDGEAQNEDTESTADGDEADDDMDNDGEPDDAEADTEDGDDIDDAQDGGETQNEDTDFTADGDEADGDVDNDGEPDDTEDDTEADTEDDDYDEDEDPGELEEYSDEDTDNRNEDDDSTDDSESERDKEEEAQVVEENKEAADRAENETENTDVQNADRNVDDAAESENKNPSETVAEQQTEPAETVGNGAVDTENDTSHIGENDNNEAQSETSDNKEDNSTDTRDQNEEQPDDIENKAETPKGEDAYRTATELPDNCVMVNASDIDMTYAQGMDSDQFWNHHGNTKEDYMRMAERIPDVQQALDSGKSLDEIKQDPELKDTAHAYFDPKNMIKVEQQADGSYSFADDGRHRIAAAQELGYEIPVEVTNLPENANASTADRTDMKPEDTTPPEDVANKSDISDETRENLGAFEQNKWDNLSQVEKEQALEKLRDSIAEDLQLENKPNIAYYNNEDPGDYGGYAASNNTIYINRFNMGDAAETADTIAHESRHCWQHERADNPQTEQDYQFKENFDDYTRPEENFEEYLNQPVEKDARDYADTVKSQIPEDTQQNNYKVDSASNYQGDSYSESNPRAPPEANYQSKTVTELPSDFESKNESDHYKKLSDVGKEAFNNSGSKEVGEGTSYKELSPTEKENLSNKCKELMNSIPKEERGNFRVPEPEKIKGVNSEGRIIEAWKPNTDGAVEGSRHMETPQKGQVIDRIGGDGGNYFSPMGEDGKPVSLKERAIGDYLPEKNISDNASYHAYEVQQDFTKENFQKAIENSDLTPAEKGNMMSDLEDYYADCAASDSPQHPGDTYAEDEKTADGVKTGTIAPMFKEDDGGATQYITPFSAAQLQKIGMIKEI